MSEAVKKTIDEEAAERPTRGCSSCGHTTTKEENRFCVWAERVLDELGKAPALVVQDRLFGVRAAFDALVSYGRWLQTCPSDIEGLYNMRMYQARNILEYAIKERATRDTVANS